MKKGRRLFALIAVFAVAFGALWPLVSAARPGPPTLPNLICTQGGFQHPPTAPAEQDDKFHCPLCVVSVDSAPPVVAAPAILATASQSPRVFAFVSSSRPAHFARSPPSRAPPSHS